MPHRKSARTRPASSRASRSPVSIDAYLATLDDERRGLLARLRRTIRAAQPDAVECISYGMPAFRVDGRVVAGFLATARGGSYYPFSGSTLDTLGGALAGFDRTKSALHFTAARPLSAALIRSLLRARLGEKVRGGAPRRTGGAPRAPAPTQPAGRGAAPPRRRGPPRARA